MDIDKSGNFVMYSQERKSIYFRVWDCKLCNQKKKNSAQQILRYSFKIYCVINTNDHSYLEKPVQSNVALWHLKRNDFLRTKSGWQGR